jgi:hypothetical protein
MIILEETINIGKCVIQVKYRKMSQMTANDNILCK